MADCALAPASFQPDGVGGSRVFFGCSCALPGPHNVDWTRANKSWQLSTGTGPLSTLLYRHHKRRELETTPAKRPNMIPTGIQL